MPTYNAVGLTATLWVTSLEETLHTSTVDGFTSSTALRERPIGADGSEKGVLQFVGEHEDMAFLMVEAGQAQRRPTPDVMPTIEPPDKETPLPDDDMTDSPLTSLDVTPAGVSERPSRQNTPQDSVMGDPFSNKISAPPQPFPNFAQAQTFLAQQSSGQAIMLTLETGYNTHLSKGAQRAMRAMKIEVFLDGHLVDTGFINPRRGDVQQGKVNLSRFAGTRITKATEKPWTYQSLPYFRDNMSPNRNAQHRWAKVSQLLQKEADARGVDNFGTRPVSAEYLRAFAGVVLPDRLQQRANLSILDIVVTLGQGKKLDPSHGVLSGPTRMTSTKFIVPNALPSDNRDRPPAQEEQNILMSNQDQESRSSIPAEVPFTSPEIPLASRPRNSKMDREDATSRRFPPLKLKQTINKQKQNLPVPAAPIGELDDTITSKFASPEDKVSVNEQTPASKPGGQSGTQPASLKNKYPIDEKVAAYARELGITLVPGMIMTQYHNNRGKICENRRLELRLGDIMRMNAGADKDRALQEVKDHFVNKESDEASEASKPPRRRNTRSRDEQPAASPPAKSPPRKKAKVRGADAQNKNLKKLKDAPSSPSVKSSPGKKAFISGSLDRPSNFGPKAAEGQDDPISNTPSQAASLAGTPIPTLGFGIPTGGRLGQQTTFGSPTPGVNSAMSSLVPSPSKGFEKEKKASRKKQVRQKEEAHFTLPGNVDSGSAITYAGDGITRPAREIRPGEFDDDELVVGIRFLVI